MSDATENHDSQKQAEPSGSNWYSAMVLGLVGMIIVLLVGLWILERGHRNRAESQLREVMKNNTEQRQKTQHLGKILASQAIQSKIQRSELPAVEVQLDGKKRVAMMLGASAGEKIGLMPGDVVLVTKPPAAVETQSGGE